MEDILLDAVVAPPSINQQKKLNRQEGGKGWLGCRPVIHQLASSHVRNRLKCPQSQCPPRRSSSQSSSSGPRRSVPPSWPHSPRKPRRPSPPRRRHPPRSVPRWTCRSGRRCRRTRSWRRASATHGSRSSSSPTSPRRPSSGGRRRRRAVRSSPLRSPSTCQGSSPRSTWGTSAPTRSARARSCARPARGGR